jgi:hypothetical protein
MGTKKILVKMRTPQPLLRPPWFKMLIWFRVRFERDADRAKQVSLGAEGTFGDKSPVLHLLQAFLVHQVVLRCNKVADPANSRPIEKTGDKEYKESKGKKIPDWLTKAGSSSLSGKGM